MMFAADNNCRPQQSDWSNKFDHRAANNLGNFGFNFNFNFNPVDSNVGYQLGRQTNFFTGPFCLPNPNPQTRFLRGAAPPIFTAEGGGRWAKRPRVQEPVNNLGNFNRVDSNLYNQSYEPESIVYQVGQKRKFISGPSLCAAAADGGAWAGKPRVQEFGHGKDKVNRMIKTVADLGVSVNDNLVDSHFCDIVRDLIADHLSRNRKVVISNNERVEMACGLIYLPKDNPARPRGEDAHFACAAEQTIGVADGVGGWALKGIDAGEYARELMSNASEAVRNMYNDNKKQPIDPTKVLKEAYENTKKNSLGLQGSSTACILSLNKETGVLRAANVGDSGFMLFRDNKMVYKSPIMQKRFNCPYQLGNCASKSDPVECAEEIVVPLATVPGDVIVLGTDGLLDNLFPSEIEECLSSFATGKDESEVAGYIANLALYNSGDKRTDSPFSVEARKAGIEHKGGKIDDITVIVARVCGCV